MRAWLSVCLLLSFSCAKRADDQGQATPAPSASPVSSAPKIPYIKMSEQRRLRQGLDAGFASDRKPKAEATAAGHELHAGVAQQCKDDACKLQRCSPLCAQWFREKMAGVNVKLSDNDLYFSCIGACMAGKPDAAAP